MRKSESLHGLLDITKSHRLLVGTWPFFLWLNHTLPLKECIACFPICSLLSSYCTETRAVSLPSNAWFMICLSSADGSHSGKKSNQPTETTGVALRKQVGPHRKRAHIYYVHALHIDIILMSWTVYGHTKQSTATSSILLPWTRSGSLTFKAHL